MREWSECEKEGQRCVCECREVVEKKVKGEKRERKQQEASGRRGVSKI